MSPEQPDTASRADDAPHVDSVSDGPHVDSVSDGPDVSDSPWATAVVLGNGDTAFIRPLTPADQQTLRNFHRAQSSDSIYRRYFSPKPDLSETELQRFTTVDMVDRAALAVELQGEFVAWASYERWADRNEAEVAFMVDDDQQGKGIATLLLEHLAAIAAANGITRFTAEVLADNRPMLAVFGKAGWPLQRRFESGVVDLDWDLANTDEFLDSVERRELRADSRAVARLLLPRAIAVVGASSTDGTVGAALWRHVSASATVPAYPVNPARDEILDADGRATPCFRSIDDLPEEVSLAVVAVPAAALDDTIAACIRKRMRGAVIVSNLTPEVAAEFPELVRRARRSGLRIIGPSSMGFASLIPGQQLQSALVDVTLPSGGAAFSMQSGTLGGSLLRRARDVGLGVSWFVSLGAKADVSGNDLLQFWDGDDATRVIGMYTESLGNPSKFARIARRVSLHTPIVAVRAIAETDGFGSTTGDRRSTLAQRAGLIEVPSVHEMIDTVRVLATQPVPRSNTVAVISNSHSPATLAASALVAAGLTVAPERSLTDWTASVEQLGDAIAAAIADPDVGAVLAIHAPAVAAETGCAAPAIDAAVAAGSGTVPVVAVMLGADEGPIAPGSPVPNFLFPEQAAAVLGRIAAYGSWVRAAAADETIDGVRRVDPGAAAELLAGIETSADADSGDRQLGPADAAALLGNYGLAMPESRHARAEDAAAVAEAIGYPVAVKAAKRRAGRSARAGVALDLRDADDVDSSVATMVEALGEAALPLTVQAMAEPGVDLRLHCRRDPSLGLTLEVGIGGLHADVTADVSERIAPVSPATAMTMLAETRALAALDAAEIDPSPVVDAIVQIGHLAVDHPSIAEIDLNPVIVSADGLAITDAAIRLADPAAATVVRRLD